MRALCSACGGTGKVHRPDGEYIGDCDCAAPSVPTGGSIDTPEFRELLPSFGAIYLREDFPSLIAHIDAHVATKVQAARDEALELAAQACDDNWRTSPAHQEFNEGCNDCAKEIRAMRSPAATDAGEQQ
jgi:hypothetical protein